VEVLVVEVLTAQPSPSGGLRLRVHLVRGHGRGSSAVLGSAAALDFELGLGCESCACS